MKKKLSNDGGNGINANMERHHEQNLATNFLSHSNEKTEKVFIENLEDEGCESWVKS